MSNFAGEMLNLSQYFPITDPTLTFLVVLLIILSAPIIMGKLRIPHIIGMVLAGVLIGKYGLNILERDASFELFGKVCCRSSRHSSSPISRRFGSSATATRHRSYWVH